MSTNKQRARKGDGATVAGFYATTCGELGVRPLPELHAALASGSNACRLGPSDGPLDDRDIEAMTTAIAHSSLSDLIIERMEMPEEGWLALTSAANACGLRCLSLTGCPIGAFSESLVASAIGRLSSVAWLRLNDAELGEHFVTALARSPLLSGKSSLMRLELSHNGIGCGGATAIAHVMVTNGINLKFLDLSYNNIADDGARALGFALAGARKDSVHRTAGVEILELEGNNIGEMGGIALGVAMLHAPMLMRVNLSRNELCDAAFHAISDSLSSGAAGLRELLLSHNAPSEESLISLLEAVTTHGRLFQLDIRGMPLKSASAKVACHMVSAHKQMQSLKVDVASAHLATDVARALRSNMCLIELALGGEVGKGAAGEIQHLLARNQDPNAMEAAKEEEGAAVVTSNFRVPGASPSVRKSSPVRPHSAAPAGNSPAKVTYRPTSARASVNSLSQGPLKPHVNVSDPRVLKPSAPNIGRRGVYSGKYRANGSAEMMTSVVGGGAQALASEIFLKCDRNQSNYLERDEFPLALKMAGLMEEAKSQGAGYVDFLFQKCDKNRDGKLSISEWGDYFTMAMAKCSVSQRRQKLDIPESFAAAVPRGYLHHPELQEVFASFSSFGYGHGATRKGHTAKMNSFQFTKLMRDAGIMHSGTVSGREPKGKLSPTAIDVIFTKAKGYNWRPRNLTYPMFLECLALVAFEIRRSFSDVVSMLGVEPLETECCEVEPEEDDEEESGPRYYPAEVTPRKSQSRKSFLRKAKAGAAERASYEKMSPDKYEEARRQEASAPTAGAIDTIALAQMLSEQIKSEIEALRSGMEQRLDEMERRVVAAETASPGRRAMNRDSEGSGSVLEETETLRCQFSDQIDALSDAVSSAVLSQSGSGQLQKGAVMSELNSRLQQRGVQC